MSLIVYEVLTAQPDFTDAPAFGIDDDRDTTNSPGGRSFAAWTGRTDRVLRFDYQTTNAEEWRTIREFIDRMGGRAAAFFLPSWQHDFELAADASPGDTTIKLAGHWYADNVTENRPDTLGRVLFTMNHLGQFATYWVVGFGEDGADDLVGIDRPLVNAMEAGRTVVGFCYLVRLATDNVESFHLSPDHARTTLGFREITHTRRLNQQESAAGPVIGSMKAAFDFIGQDEDPLYLDPLTYAVLGPFTAGLPQAENFQTEWTANLVRATNQFKLTGPLGVVVTTPLYNAPGVARKIAAAFDASASPAIAWELDGEITVGWTASSVIQRLSFAGYSPVMFNTFAIDSTTTAGDATLAVFYLKPQDSTIYCRIIAESFATERRYCNSPVAALYLQQARRYEGRLEIVGIDTGHRLARWRSDGYLTPIPIQVASVSLVDFSGDYQAIVVATEGEDAAAVTLETIMTGEYLEARVYASAPEEIGGLVSITGEISGSYVEMRIPATGGPDQAKVNLDTAIPGTYSQIAFGTTAEDESSVTLQTTITGSYGT